MSKPLQRALNAMQLATSPHPQLAFWGPDVMVKRVDRDLVCDTLEKILREHPELVPLEVRES